MRLLSVEDTQELISIPEATNRLETAYRELGLKRAVNRPRSDLVVPRGPRSDYWLSTMEGALPESGVAAIRLRSDRYEEEVRFGTPTASKWAGQPGSYCGLVVLYDLDSAEVLAIINDGYLQLIRVAGASVVAARHLAHPESRRLGIIGAGWQALYHARAYAAEFPLQAVKLYCRTESTRNRVAHTLEAELHIPVIACTSAEETVRDSDLVACCTTAQAPVLDPDWLAPGCFVSAIRYYREIGPGKAGAFDAYVVHPPEYGWQAYHLPQETGTESHDLYRGDRLPDTAVPLEAVVAGQSPGRRTAGDRIVFNNHAGMGIQFAALGRAVYDAAVVRSVGRELPREWFLQQLPT